MSNLSDFNYISEPSQHLLCPICLSPFVDPVTSTTCSHTFCRECIHRAVGHSAQCPVDRSPLDILDLQPANSIIRCLVGDLIVECSNMRQGCSRTLRRDELKSHLSDDCMYIPVDCEMPGCTTSLPLTQMLVHQDEHGYEMGLQDLLENYPADFTSTPTSIASSTSPPLKRPRLEIISQIEWRWTILSPDEEPMGEEHALARLNSNIQARLLSRNPSGPHSQRSGPRDIRHAQQHHQAAVQVREPTFSSTASEHNTRQSSLNSDRPRPSPLTLVDHPRANVQINSARSIGDFPIRVRPLVIPRPRTADGQARNIGRGGSIFPPAETASAESGTELGRPPSSSRPLPRPPSAEPEILPATPFFARVLRDREAKEGDEMNLHVGEIIHVQTMNGGGWWSGQMVVPDKSRNKNRDEGRNMFPRNYVAIQAGL